MDGAIVEALAHEIVELDEGAHPRGKVGFMLLATEQTIQDDMMRLRPDGVGFHFARVPIPDDISVDSLTDLGQDLSMAASTLLPDGSLNVVSYACTSGSLVLGEENVNRELQLGVPNAKPTSLITAVISALNHLRVKKLAVVTPYLDEINAQEKVYLEDVGFEVSSIKGLGLRKDSEMVRVPTQFIREFARRNDHEDAEAIFISCGALRSLDCVQALEDELGKPVICSNQALYWHVLDLLGIRARISGCGKLLDG
ncbi:arylmalonate decarboxylase [Pseudovibrio brasiliensis]|uniref:Arylmalonate decarboxylase n=1 Tax=Pseudovibrio brasiliensis TaxID=1898042 RepID=A0ABX8APN8_9HYPH|nr:arylmalonate decarboxylase [Pseudovibrio brasiliensis]QUS56533.1 arylmalonate decarboxylase [Pseudovibrio brasiliensis]